MLKHDILLAEKYRHLKVEQSYGKVVLANLPERTEQERKLIRHVFSSFHCRLCGDCCRGFSFSSEEPNFNNIANKIEMNIGRFTMKLRDQTSSAMIFRADPSFSAKCGFFESGFDARKVPREVLEAGEDFAEEGAPFGCGIYNHEPRVCSMFPVSAGIVENPGNGEHLAKNAMHITSECKPVMELFAQGIGHILGREILEFWTSKENAWMNFGATLANAAGAVTGLIISGGIDGFHFLTEGKEPVFPIKRAGFPPGSSG